MAIIGLKIWGFFVRTIWVLRHVGLRVIGSDGIYFVEIFSFLFVFIFYLWTRYLIFIYICIPHFFAKYFNILNEGFR